MLNQNQKATPAYKGARFDTHGYCLAHIDVRLCRLTSNGQYKIVRKTCYKCGSAALMNEAANNNQGGGIHGYKKKSVVHRTIPSDLYSGHHHHDDREQSKRCEPKPPSSSPISPKKDRLHYGEDNLASTRRRGRSLSPPRRSKCAPKPPLSKSHIISKISKTNDVAVKELLHIKSPFSKKMSKGSASHSSTTRSSHQKQKPNPSTIKNDTISRSCGQGECRAQTTAQGIGHCHIHREITLSIRRTTMPNGQWHINRDVCPLCFPSDFNSSNESSLTSSSCDSTKNLKQILDVTSPNTPRSVLSLNNNKYYTSSPVPIVEYNNNSMGEGDERCTSASPAVLQKKTNKKNHWKVLPNSTARIARRAEKKGREQQQQQQVQAYDAWETLPLY